MEVVAFHLSIHSRVHASLARSETAMRSSTSYARPLDVSRFADCIWHFVSGRESTNRPFVLFLLTPTLVADAVAKETKRKFAKRSDGLAGNWMLLFRAIFPSYSEATSFPSLSYRIRHSISLSLSLSLIHAVEEVRDRKRSKRFLVGTDRFPDIVDFRFMICLWFRIECFIG